MVILCKLFHHFYDTCYDLAYGKSYIPKCTFITPTSSKINLAHPTHTHILRSIVTHITKEEYKPSAILDVGCGYGRALNYFSRHFNCPVDGVEIVEVLAHKSQFYNRNRSNVTIVFGDATEAHLPNAYDLIFMFNPFPLDIFIKFIHHISRFSSTYHVILLNHNYHENILESFRANVSWESISISHCGKRVVCISYLFKSSMA